MTLLLALLLTADPAARQVTLPIDEYERLRRLEERPSLTVVDLLRVEGSFGARDLQVTLTGRAAGTLPSVGVLALDGARLHSCQGDALVARGEDGAFALTPLAPRFQVRCKVALDGSDRLEATATRAVLEVTSGVSDGELSSTGGAGGERTFAVVRRLPGQTDEALAPTVAGRYRLTLLPDETRFVYQLDVRNPSRGHRRFEVALRPAEHVESVDARVAWDAEGGRYRFDLPPGETTVTLSGRLSEPRFVAPVDASLQYLLVESHPLVRPDVKPGPRRVGVGEAGLSPEYRGAQAFLLDGTEEVSWTATRLEALKTAGLALTSLDQVFFLGADGQARGEATFAIDNQGAPALALPSPPGPGAATFASVDGEPAFLTRDADGRLFLPLAQGHQQVLVQDARPFDVRLGLGVARLPLPQAGVPASRARVELRYPEEWLPLYESLAPVSRWPVLDPGVVASLVVLLVAAERLLALAGLSRARRLALTAALVALGAASAPARHLLLALALLPLAALLAARLLRALSGAWRAVAAVGIAFAALLAAGVVLVSERPEPANVNYVSADLVAKRLEAPPPPAAPAAAPGRAVAEAARSQAQGYQGLPAHLELPSGARRSVFPRELLATDAPRSAYVVLASARLVGALALAAALAAAALALWLRRDLAQGARRLAAAFRGAPPEAAPAAPSAPAPG